VVTFSLKAARPLRWQGTSGRRGLAGRHPGAWVTSNAFEALPFLDDYVERESRQKGHGKLGICPGQEKYLTPKRLLAVCTDGWNHSFPHRRAESCRCRTQIVVLQTMETSPCHTYLSSRGASRGPALPRKAGGRIFWASRIRLWTMRDTLLGPRIGKFRTFWPDSMKTSVAIHAFGQRNRPRELRCCADRHHGVVPIPEDMQKRRRRPPLICRSAERIEKALEALNIQSPRSAASHAATFIRPPASLT